MTKAIFIVGPTAVGKTALAFDIAERFNGELVSADSVQVFKSLDIISGKDFPLDYTGNPPIHLLDVVNPTTSFAVSDYYRLASEKIKEIHKRGKIPVIVGGTGLYVEVLLQGLNETAKPNTILREKLSKLTLEELQKLIPEEVLEQLNDSDRNNPRRLMRKIEINSEALQPATHDLPTRGKFHLQPQTENFVIGLYCDREALKYRIAERVNSRLKEGALPEANRLFKNYKYLTRQVKDANGYKQLFSFLKNEMSLEEAIYRWKVSEYRHAKNQMTWFRKYGEVKWFDIADSSYKKNIENDLKLFFV